MSITLELRNLWTATGGPLSWRFDGADELDLRELLAGLETSTADPTMPSAVMVVTEEDGTIIGAWNRSGAAQLRTWIGMIPRGANWMELRSAIDDAVTGP